MPFAHITTDFFRLFPNRELLTVYSACCTAAHLSFPAPEGAGRGFRAQGPEGVFGPYVSQT